MSVFEFEFSEEELEEIEGAEELKAHPAGEVLLELTGFVLDDTTGGVVRKDKNGFPYILPRLDIKTDGKAAYNDFTIFVPLPASGREAKAQVKARKAFKDLTDAFNVTRTTKFDFRDLIGETAWGIISIDEDTTYGQRNRLEHWVTGK